MKKNFAGITKGAMIPGIIGAILLCAPFHLFAETPGSRPAASLDPEYTLGAEKVPASFFAMALLDPRFLKKFEKAFPAATELKWNEEGAFTRLYFKQGNKTVRALVRRSGSIQNMIAYYPADQLPSHVAREVRDEYKGYRIAQVTEVDYENRKAYIMNLEGMDDWLVVKYLEGEISLENRYQYSR